MSSLCAIFSAGVIPNKAHRRHHHAHIKIARRVRVFQPSCMAVDVTTTPVSDVHVRPRITDFTPCVWGDAFSANCFDEKVQQKYSEEMETLVKEAREKIMDAAPSTTTVLILIDTVERLGLAYHFETEIEEKLKQMYDLSSSSEEEDEDNCDDLFTTALRFRLLRQHRYHVSCNEYFRKFVDKDKRLNENLFGDIEGVLSLFEAAQVRVHNEDVLDGAAEFTKHHLNIMVAEYELDSSMKEKVQLGLEFPLHKSPKLFNLLSYIPIYEKEDSRDELLLRLAKLNFNFSQNIYRKEIFELFGWWNKLDLVSKLPFVRDRVVGCYIWGIVHGFEPQYSLVRKAATKIYQLIAVIDDTYDNYATLEEMELFDQALDRWNMEAIDELPDTLQTVYKYIMSESEDFKLEAERQGKSCAVPFFIEAVKRLGKAYCKEQKWIKNGEMPSFQEYMLNSRITGSIFLVFPSMSPGIETFTKESLDWLLTAPQIFLSTTQTGRLLNDLASYQRESREGNMHTVVDCYMQDKGVSREETILAFNEMIEDGWKHVNEAWLKSSSSREPKEMLEQFFYMLRMAELGYHNGQDHFTEPEKLFNPLARALLLDPLSI